MSTTLQLDKKVPDTTLAEAYLDSIKEFHSIGNYNNSGLVVDTKGAKIFGAICDPKPAEYLDTIFKPSNYIKLVSGIKENTELICQLEYLIRNKPVSVTKFNLDMVIKNLLGYASVVEPLYNNKSGAIVIGSNSSLIDLGCMELFRNGPIEIIADAGTAIVCYLFTSLCIQAGLQFTVAFVIDPQIFSGLENHIIKEKVLAGGCVGVVTAHADVDSAVDTFLFAGTGDVCGFRRILVQESICDRLRKAFQWKAKTNQFEGVSVEERLSSLSSEVFVVDGKVFLYEYMGADAVGENVVVIEAYRTTQELLTLLGSPFCVSLWSSDVAESNEIAFRTAVPFVWINDYAILEGPAKVARAYYSRVHDVLASDITLLAGHKEVVELQRTWAKLSIGERREILQNIKGTECYHRFAEVVAAAETHTNNFVHVSDSTVVMVFDIPREVYAIDVHMLWCSRFVDCFLKGSGFLVAEMGVSDESHELLKTLSESGLPVRGFDSLTYTGDCNLHLTTRAVWSSYGTIFAN